MKFVVFAKEKAESQRIKNELIKELIKENFILDENNPQFVFVVGGDGTFLRVVHHYIDKLDSIKFIGIMCGTLGFFYDFKEEDIKDISRIIKEDLYQVERHSLIECHLENKTFYAVNEVRFENPFHTLVCNVKIDDKELEKFHGNGLLVCSSLGSTAYNKSLGGAVISRELDLLQLTEISTIQNNIYRSLGSSLIINPNSKITFEGDFSGVLIGYDHLNLEFDSNTLEVSLSNKKVSIIYHKDYSSLQSLKRSFIK